MTAFVVLREPAGAEALRAWCRERLEPHKVPKSVHQVPRLPRNPGGKLERERLELPPA